MNQKLHAVVLICSTFIFIFSACTSGARIPEPVPPQNDTHFYFVQLTDTHLGDANHIDRTTRIISAINDLPFEIKCVVHTGDVTSDNILQDSIPIRGKEIFSQLRYPIHFVPGNHDIDKRNLQPTRQAFEENFGPLLTVQNYEGVQFVTVFTEPLAEGYEMEDFDPLLELEAVLANGKPTLVFHHSPSPGDFYRNTMHESWVESARSSWESLLNRHNVLAVFAGHYHRDEHHWLGEVPLYVSGPVGSWYGRQPTFRIFEYKNGRLGYRTQYILMEEWKNGKIPKLFWE